jgi:hypothetical protein
MFFAITLRRLLRAAAAFSVILILWNHLPPEWQSEIQRAARHGLGTLGDVAAAALRAIARLLAA